MQEILSDMEEINPHPDFLKGFNEGYILSTHEPDLADKIAAALGETERAKGFKDGQKQYKDEVSKNKYPSWLTKDYTKEETGGQQKSKDDLEKEKD